MTAPVLSFRHVFGLKCDVFSPLHYVDDSTVLYAAGHQLVLHNTHTRQQRTIPASYDTQPHTRAHTLSVQPNARSALRRSDGLAHCRTHLPGYTRLRAC